MELGTADLGGDA